MKPKVFTAVILFISAYSPLFVIFAVKDFDFEVNRFNHLGMSLTLIIISVISIITLYASIDNISVGNMSITIKSVRNRSLDVINYTIPYLFTAFDIDLSKPEDIITITLFLLILLILTLSSQSIFINPLLALKGYSFYDVDYEFDSKKYSNVLISKEELQVDNIYYVRSLTRFLYLVTKKKRK